MIVQDTHLKISQIRTEESFLAIFKKLNLLPNNHHSQQKTILHYNYYVRIFHYIFGDSWQMTPDMWNYYLILHFSDFFDIDATIRTCQQIHCLPYTEFFLKLIIDNSHQDGSYRQSNVLWQWLKHRTFWWAVRSLKWKYTQTIIFSYFCS